MSLVLSKMAKSFGHNVSVDKNFCQFFFSLNYLRCWSRCSNAKTLIKSKNARYTIKITNFHFSKKLQFFFISKYLLFIFFSEKKIYLILLEIWHWRREKKVSRFGPHFFGLNERHRAEERAPIYWWKKINRTRGHVEEIPYLYTIETYKSLQGKSLRFLVCFFYRKYKYFGKQFVTIWNDKYFGKTICNYLER